MKVEDEAKKNNLFSIKLHHGGKFTPSPKRMYVGGKVNYVDKIDVDLFNELDDDVLLNAPVVGSSKSLALGWINEADVGESSVGKNDNVNVDGNVHEEQAVNVNDYTIDDRFKLDIDENLNLDDYIVYGDENMNENVNVDENVNADDKYEQDNVEDEEVIGTSVAGCGSASEVPTQLVMASASQHATGSASQPARAKQPQRQPQRVTSQPACAPKPTRQTKTKNFAASGSHGAMKTPTRQSQRQKAAKKTPTTK
nr:O-fucosyltransferase family protein [Tanacetum cinerariifolium]